MSHRFPSLIISEKKKITGYWPIDILLGGYFQFDLEIIGFYAFSFFYNDKNDTSKSNGKDNELENIFFHNLQIFEP